MASAMPRKAMPSSAAQLQARSGGGLLQCQPEEPRGIQPVHRRPAVRTVADESSEAVPARAVDQRGHKSVVALSVHGGLQAHDAEAIAALLASKFESVKT